MKIVNLTAGEVLNALNYETPSINHYRKNIYYGDEDTLGIYYKDFIDSKLCDNKYMDSNYNIRDEYVKELNEHINMLKEIRNNEYVWEHYALLKKIALINRLEELKDLSKLENPTITGLALYQGYPVGVLIPRLLTYYERLCDINMDELSLQEKKIIFDKVHLWVEELIKRDVYTNNIYSGNIVVNPYDYTDVVLDGLDDAGVVRIESKLYVNKLKRKGLDLQKDSFNNLNKIKKLYIK